MKKKITILLLLVSFSSYSQTWFDLGIKGGIGGGFLINNTINNDSRFDLLPQMNRFYGGKIGVNFGELFGLTFDMDYGKYGYGFTQAKVYGKDQLQQFKCYARAEIY